LTIFFDIDGVIRRLDLACFGYEPSRWDEKNNDGLNVLQIVNKDPSICERCNPSEYLNFINSLDKAVFLSNQLVKWIPYTDRWLNRNVTTCYEVIYTNNNKFEYMDLEKDFIFDDYPLFDNYNNVMLVDRKYNKDTIAPIRIKNLEDMEYWYKRKV
jgi:hypothetical protein